MFRFREDILGLISKLLTKYPDKMMPMNQGVFTLPAPTPILKPVDFTGTDFFSQDFIVTDLMINQSYF